MIKVQIVISGQYYENKGDEQHPRWRAGGSHSMIMVQDVPLLDAPEVMKEISARMAEMSWSDEWSSCHFGYAYFAPNRMNQYDLAAFDYEHYSDIKSYPKEDLMAFLKCFGEEPEEAEGNEVADMYELM